MYRTLTRNSPSPGCATGSSVRVKSVGLGRPTGRAPSRICWLIAAETAMAASSILARMLGAGLILFLAALQGATELFPVSSLGHAVVVPSLLHINFDQSSPAFVPVLAMLHLGTAAALLWLYRAQWGRIAVGLGRAVV